MTNIQLTESYFNSKEAWKFFTKHEARQFIVEFLFSSTIEMRPNYGLLLVHTDSMGGNVCTLNGDFLYQYGDKCIITGYCPINIEH